MSHQTGQLANSAPPVFILSSALPDKVTIADICETVENEVGFGSVFGCQYIEGTGVWRLSATNVTYRAKLAGMELSIRGCTFKLYSKNPKIILDESGNEIETTKLTIGNVPISISNTDIEGELIKLGVKFRSKLNWEKARKEDGTLTRWVTGRRFASIDVPTVHLPKRFKVSGFSATTYYKQQPKPVFKCFACQKEGHKRGDPTCEMKNIQNHQAWSANQNNNLGTGEKANGTSEEQVSGTAGNHNNSPQNDGDKSSVSDGSQADDESSSEESDDGSNNSDDKAADAMEGNNTASVDSTGVVSSKKLTKKQKKALIKRKTLQSKISDFTGDNSKSNRARSGSQKRSSSPAKSPNAAKSQRVSAGEGNRSRSSKK